MTRLPKTPVHRSRSPLLPRLGAVVAVALASAGIVMVACSGQPNNGGPSSTAGPFCPVVDAATGYCEPDAPPCFLTTESNCNGEWYCWPDDHKWHCAPPDSGPPPDAPPPGDEDAAGDAGDAADDAPPAGDAGLDAAPPADASDSGG